MRNTAIFKCSLRGAGGHSQGIMQLRDVLSQKLFPHHRIYSHRWLCPAPALALPWPVAMSGGREIPFHSAVWGTHHVPGDFICGVPWDRKLHLVPPLRTTQDFRHLGLGQRGANQPGQREAALPRSSPFPIRIYTHAEPPRASLLAPPDHEAIARLEDVQRAGDAWEGHRAYEDGDVLGQAEGQERPL